MPFTIKLDTRKLEKALNNVALDIANQIRTNCKNQLDGNDEQMDAYSEAYVIAKAKYQSKSKSLNLSRAKIVNMKRTGKMLNSISVAKIGKHFEVYIADKSRAIIGYYHQMGLGVPKREFFGISKRNEKRFFERHFQEEILRK